MENNQLVFTISGEEFEKAQKWIKKQKKKYGDNCGTIGERFSYKFVPTGLGCIKTIKDNLTGKKLDLTTYDNF